MKSINYSDFIFNIPPSVNFIDTLADYYILLNYSFHKNMNDLIILPTRNACHKLAVTLSEKICDKFKINYAILPKIIPVGDIDDDEVLQNSVYDIFNEDVTVSNDLSFENQISYIDKILLLSKLVKQKASCVNCEFENISWGQSLKIAVTLSKFIDTVNNEELDLSNLKFVFPDNLEYHWQDILKFLEIVNVYWDSIKNGKLDFTEYRVLMVKRFADSLKKSKYRNVILAGSTGSMVFTKYLIKNILDINENDSNKFGCVILPGFDNNLSDDAWNNISPIHPQYNLKELLKYLNVNHKNIKNIPTVFNQDNGVELFSSLLNSPSSVIVNELEKVNSNIFSKDILSKVINIKCDNQYDEAMAIAYAIYDLYQNDVCKNAIVICQDRGFIKKFTACLNRFGLSYIDGAGIKLNSTNLGECFLLLSRLIDSNFDFSIFQSFLRNNNFNFIFKTDLQQSFYKNWIEKNILRGKRIYFENNEIHPIDFLITRKILNLYSNENKAFIDEIITFFKWLKNITNEFYEIRLSKKSFIDIFNIHINLFKTLVNLANIDLETVNIFNQFVSNIFDSKEGFISEELINLSDYQDIVEILISHFIKRNHKNVNVNILGSIESRMQTADFIVIPCLNEGIFPKETETDPWMNKLMRDKFGLPPLEKKIGLASHDFAQFLCSAKNIMLTHSVKVGNNEVIPSRLLFRFMLVAEKFSLKTDKKYEQKIMNFVKNIDLSDQKKGYARPHPCPPINARPTELYSTVIEKLIQDPYIVYASHILKLKKIHEINEGNNPFDFGIIIHDAIKSFTDKGEIKPELLYKEIYSNFISMFGDNDYLFYFWNPYFHKISEYFIEEFIKDVKESKQNYSEIKGKLIIDDKFCVSAKADRIDLLKDGTLKIIDYKTGKIPEAKNIISGKNSQLIIESLIAMYGSFKSNNIKVNGTVNAIKYYSLKRNFDKYFTVSYQTDGKIGKIDFNTVIDDTYKGIKRLFEYYNDYNTSYIAENEDFKSDYEYLKRWKEWGES